MFVVGQFIARSGERNGSNPWCHPKIGYTGTYPNPDQLLLDYVYGDGLVGTLSDNDVALFQCSLFSVYYYTLQSITAANKTAVGIDTRRIARYLCDALYGECYRITRPRTGAYPDDRTRLLV